MRKFLLLAVLLPECAAFTASQISRQASSTTSTLLQPRESFLLQMSSNEEPQEDTSPTPAPKSSGSNVDPMPPPQMMRTPPSPPPKRLDPLLASLTRMDPQAGADKPTTTIPFLGEVNMDKTLFIALPTVTFALLGFFSFFMVAMNSGDAVVDAVNEWNENLLNPTPKELDPNQCRGLCSSQESDMEGLRIFMNTLGGK